MPGNQADTLTKLFPAHNQVQERIPVICDERRGIATLRKTAGLAERVSLKLDICARKIQFIKLDNLLDLSPGDIPEDYLFWLNLCAAHGVKLVTPGRVFDPNEYHDWIRILEDAGFDWEEINNLNCERARKKNGESSGRGTSLFENPPAPYVYEASLGGITIDFDQLRHMEKVWALAERHPIPVVSENAGLPVSFVRRAISVERLLFYQGLWLDAATGELRKGHWPPVMKAEQAGHILANRQRC
jgi:hypothetical protein